jgi:hypothetical protein
MTRHAEEVNGDVVVDVSASALARKARVDDS